MLKNNGAIILPNIYLYIYEDEKEKKLITFCYY